MTAPPWMLDLLGWKEPTDKARGNCVALFSEARAPNLADVGSKESLRIAGSAMRQLDIPTGQERASLNDAVERTKPDGTLSVVKTSAGKALEEGVERDLKESLTDDPSGRSWLVTPRGAVSDYVQFKHMKQLHSLFESDSTLRATVGRDYQVKSDVYVGVRHNADPALPLHLHAAVACKWTIRSDRVQNVRHEFATLVRSRRGRLPHLVLVTAEPLPSRIISIARGTGELDAVYHLLFDEVALAVQESNRKQIEMWDEMVSQRRVLPYKDLAPTLLIS